MGLFSKLLNDTKLTPTLSLILVVLIIVLLYLVYDMSLREGVLQGISTTNVARTNTFRNARNSVSSLRRAQAIYGNQGNYATLPAKMGKSNVLMLKKSVHANSKTKPASKSVQANSKTKSASQLVQADSLPSIQLVPTEARRVGERIRLYDARDRAAAASLPSLTLPRKAQIPLSSMRLNPRASQRAQNANRSSAHTKSSPSNREVDEYLMLKKMAIEDQGLNPIDMARYKELMFWAG
tara:strand:+ start:182 stop:895 length:714 start_codon:yes stop_codon:yes gene_type:complete